MAEDNSTYDQRTPLQKIEAPVAIAPGNHDIGAEFRTSRTRADVNFSFTALPGEHYTVNRSIIWTEGLLGRSPTMVTAWIEDSHGNKVTAMQTVHPGSIAAPSNNTYIYAPTKRK
ncbi:MAG: hypothetical protein WDN72_02195 [Alphaproteobacteria bacterium]